MSENFTQDNGYVSIRKIADMLGISKGTVSLALNNSERVSKKTLKKVQAVAAELGYRKSAIVSTMMSSMRRSTIGEFRETIAVLNGNEDKEALRRHATLPTYYNGVLEECADIGFKADEFWLFDPELNEKKLSAILHARGIRGGIIMGHTHESIFKSYSKIWRDFKIVSVGISVHNPAYEMVSSNHFEVAKTAFHKLRQMGFKRPALILDEYIDNLVDGRFYGGYLRVQMDYPPEERTPIFTENNYSPTYRENLVKFLKRERPDVLMYMLAQTGYFLDKNVRMADGRKYPIVQLERRNDVGIKRKNWSGMEQNNDIVGKFAVKRLAALLNMTSKHIHSPQTLIAPDWIESAFLRKRAKNR